MEVAQKLFQHLSKVAPAHFCGMLYLIGSILTNVLLLVWLRLLRVPVPALITLNYFVCVAIAILIAPPHPHQLSELPPLAWGILGLLGILFITVFVLTGIATQRIGIGLTGMLAKLSVVIPVGISAIWLKEPITKWQLIGLILGIVAIIWLHAPYLRSGSWKALVGAFQLGLLLWLGNGVIDSLFKAFQPQWQILSPIQVPIFIMSVAGILGVFFHIWQGKAGLLLRWKVWSAALLLGNTNLLSIFFYLNALAALPAVQFFLWNNLGIILLSGGMGILFFREKISWEVGLGYGLGAVAIILTT